MSRWRGPLCEAGVCRCCYRICCLEYDEQQEQQRRNARGAAARSTVTVTPAPPDLNAFQTHLNCAFDLNDVLRLGNEAYDAEQMGMERWLERTEFEPSQLTNTEQFLALMIIVGITFNHDELLVDALSLAQDSLEWLVFQQFATRPGRDYAPIDPRASDEPLGSAADLMRCLDSLQMQRFTLSPFVSACQHGRIDLVERWVHFALANAHTRLILQFGLTVACESNEVDCVVAILKHVDSGRRQLWPLLRVAFENHATSVVSCLLPAVAATDEMPEEDDLFRVALAAVNHGDNLRTRKLFELFVERKIDVSSVVSSMVRAAAVLPEVHMLTSVFRFFERVMPARCIAEAIGDARFNHQMFEILIDSLEWWKGDAAEFDDALGVAVTATAAHDNVSRLEDVLKLQLREPGARHMRAFPWAAVVHCGNVKSAAVLLADPRIAVTWMYLSCHYHFGRNQCRTLVTICEHPRMVGAVERLLDEEQKLPLRYRRRVAQMWLTDICMALRPLRLPSLVVDEIVRHLPTMTAMQSEQRLTKVIININERSRSARRGE